MERLNVEQLSIEQLFTGHNGIFSIPLYQRPYSWKEDQCDELWSDLYSFTFPNGHADQFNPRTDFYFLGNMVVYNNSNHQVEVVDGQQRIISLLLLMRALYEELRDTENGRRLGKCIWCFEENGDIDPSAPRIDSKAIMEQGNPCLSRIIATGAPLKNDKYACAENYRFFRQKIVDFKNKTPNNLEKLAARLLRNVYITIMSANSEDEALQLFLTINDRGMALRIEDIFQAKLFENAKIQYGDSEAQAFLNQWKVLGERCVKLFAGDKNLSPIEFAFLLYAQSQNDKTTWKNLKCTYGANDYALLKSEKTLPSINAMIDAFSALHTVSKQPSFFLTDDVARKAHTVIRCNKTAAWYALSVYFFSNRKPLEELFDERFSKFLDKFLAYLTSSATIGEARICVQPGRARQTATMLLGEVPKNLKVLEQSVQYGFNHLYDLKSLDYVQKILLTWWTFSHVDQPRISWNAKLETEHIFAKSLAERRPLCNPNNIELLGNLALVDKCCNHKASNYTFPDKRKNYQKSINAEIQAMAKTFEDFDEGQIIARNQRMLTALVSFLKQEGFLAAPEFFEQDELED